MTNFWTAAASQMNDAYTDNGALAKESTLNIHLDFFSKVAALRKMPGAFTPLFSKSFALDPEKALRILFYARDIRGGQGERNIFRLGLKYLVSIGQFDMLRKLVPLVPEYGRWDDLWVLFDSEVWSDVTAFVFTQLKKDISAMGENQPISLLAKWMPSENASSLNTKKMAKSMIAASGLSSRQYRKTLTALRTHLRIVEQKMCGNEWRSIDYSQVPSKASLMYRKAFQKRDGARYQAFLEAVEKGEAKINAGTLYPHELVYDYLYSSGTKDATLNALWANLPNFLTELMNGIVVADVSGSMYGTPMAASIGLAMYIAERNPSEYWRDKFITFSSIPRMQQILGNTLQEKINNLSKAHWSNSTNLQAVFDAILAAGQQHKLPESAMPEFILIISDKQFDIACPSNTRTNLEEIKLKYSQAGYEMPKLVFWNVDGSNTAPATMLDSGTALISGSSPSVLKNLFKSLSFNPLDVMQEILYDSRYDAVGELFS